MSRYTGPKTRINRRYGMAIFPPNKAFERRSYPPGMHGQRLRRKVTDYGTGLQEKQKARIYYGLTEKQFRIVFERAKQTKGVIGEVFLSSLEMRLDSVAYSAGFSRTRRGARQMVCHGHFFVNGHAVDIPSYQCNCGDVISMRQVDSSRHIAMRNLEDTRYRAVPPWIQTDSSSLSCAVNRAPRRDEIALAVKEQLIVEFYSR
ncbi:MAG: 30S ribosomal protein S4 [Puniceicoccales bacterium]|jgi:small subunit ribosomal protein S4|nr:30S ribosomal protein S4 [Puniceicoccales bacterium]